MEVKMKYTHHTRTVQTRNYIVKILYIFKYPNNKSTEN